MLITGGRGIMYPSSVEKAHSHYTPLKSMQGWSPVHPHREGIPQLGCYY